MKKIVTVAAIALGSLGLNACATVQQGAEAIGCGVSGGLTPAQQMACFIRKAQEATVQICGFLPVAATVTGILGAGVTDAFMIAAMVCEAVKNAPPPPTGMARTTGAVYGKVRGVQVQGRFVK